MSISGQKKGLNNLSSHLKKLGKNKPRKVDGRKEIIKNRKKFNEPENRK